VRNCPPMFASLRSYNYRLWAFSRLASFIGSGVQTVALGWVVLDLTGSGTALGVVTTLVFLPVLFGGAHCAAISARLDTRRLLIWVHTVNAAAAAILAVATLTGTVSIGLVYSCAFVEGLAICFDGPARNAFVSELVEARHFVNAIALNNLTSSLAKIAGPAAAAALITLTGPGVCFAVNAASFLALALALALMRVAELHPRPAAVPIRAAVRDAVRHVWVQPHLRAVLMATGVMGLLALQLPVTLPLLARDTLHGTATTYGALLTCFGVGSVLRSLHASRTTTDSRAGVMRACGLFGIAFVGLAWTPSTWSAGGVLVLAGIAAAEFLVHSVTALQAVQPDMRTRVMGLYSSAIVGLSAVGGPLVGWTGEHVSPRSAVCLGAAAALLAAVLVRPVVRLAPATYS
jgi:MFS family permease